jgi:hypothetical protein
MVIEGMYAGQLFTWNFWGTGPTSVSLTFAMPAPFPDAFSQVHLGSYDEFEDRSSAEVAIVQVTNSKGQTKTFPGPGSNYSVRAHGESDMTSITFRMRTKGVRAFAVWQIFIGPEYWID